MARDYKRIHNVKDRHTGRKRPKRSKHDETVKTRSVGTGRGFIPIKPQPRPTTVRCNCSGEDKDKVNERLFTELEKIVPPATWNELTGTWERKVLVIPRFFARKHKAHMHHFRTFARERMGAHLGQKPNTRR